MATPDQNPMPDIKIFRSPVDIVCGCIGRFATMLPSSSDLSLSEHRGASEMLDEALDDDQGVLEFEPDPNSWDVV